MAVVADRVKQSVSNQPNASTAFNLSDTTLAGFQTFVSALSIGSGSTAKTYYTAVASDGTFEVGEGTVTEGTPDTITRDEVLDSSTGSAIDFSSKSGITVFLTYPASKAVFLDETDDLTVGTNALFVDSSATRVGVGNNSPTVPLDVTGAIKSSSTISDSLGNLRVPELIDIDSSTYDITKSGVYHATVDTTITFGTGASELQPGDIVVIYNDHSATITIQPGDFTAFQLDGETTHKTSLELAVDSLATITVLTTTKAVISSANVSDTP